MICATRGPPAHARDLHALLMKILLTNDDGPFGQGICVLRKALEEFGEVTVVCPAEERSGVGHAITWAVPVLARAGRLADGTPAHVLSGTPADCVKFALGEVFDSPPDLVVSGPNVGSNAGVDLFYSGTVAAALEGGLNGIASVALSTNGRNADNMDAVAEQALRVLRLLLDKEELSERRVFNVNIPQLTGEEPPICFTRQSAWFPRWVFVRTDGPSKRVHYWLDSTTSAGGPCPDSDVAALEAGSISITPLRCDLTDAGELDRLIGCMSSQVSATGPVRTGGTEGSSSPGMPGAKRR